MAIERDENGAPIIKPRPRRPLQGTTPSAGPEEPTNTRKEPREGRRDSPREGVEVAGSVDRPSAVRNGNAPATPVREDERGVLADWQCGAKLRGEKAGLLCRNPRIKGAKKCRMHGSATLRAREKAHETIILASYPAAKKLRDILNDPDAPYTAVIAAARDLLDRADLMGKTKVEVEMPAFQQTLAKLVRFRRPGADDEPAITGEVVDAEIVQFDGDGEPLPIEYRPGRPNINDPLPPSPEVKVNSDDTPPSYIDPATGGRRRQQHGPRTSEMRR